MEIIDNYRRTPINPERMTIKSLIREWGHYVLIGKFYLKGKNPITDNGLWPLLQKVRSEYGWCALVDSAEIFRVASIMNLTYNGTGEVESITVNYISRWGGVTSKDFTPNDFSETLTDPKEFAILLNNVDRKANFQDSEKILDFIDNLYQVAAFDAEASRTRMFIETSFYPTPAQKQRIRENIDALDMLIYASLGDGKPMELKPWNVESKFPVIKQMMDYQFGMFRRFNGIAFNTSKKEDRHLTKEIELVEEQFESFENIWQQETESFLRDCYDKFGGEEYNLVKDGESVFRIGKLVEEEQKEQEKLKKEGQENINEKKVEQINNKNE